MFRREMLHTAARSFSCLTGTVLALLAAGIVACSSSEATGSGSAAESSSAAAAPAAPSAALFGPHETCWIESEGDEGPIPYKVVDLEADGSYHATIYDTEIGPPDESSWLAAHPNHKVDGTYALSTETITPATGHPFDLQYVTFTESADSAWTYDLSGRPEAHTFKVVVTPNANGSYDLGWENAYYVNPEYVPPGVPCVNTNVDE